jgi:hypothetical protein
LRLVVGALLVVFGLQWLRKAILRASGFKAIHDKDAIYAEQTSEARAAATMRQGVVDDWYAKPTCRWPSARPRPRRHLAGRRRGAARGHSGHNGVVVGARGMASTQPGATAVAVGRTDMTALRRFATFWYDFIVGDDWTLAVGVTGGLGLTALLVHVTHVDAWWLLPVVVVALLTVSLAVAVSPPTQLTRQ